MADVFPLRFEQDGTTFGQVVRRVRVGREMDLRALSEASGIALGSLSDIENDRVDPRLTTLVKLAAGLRLPVYALIGHDCNSNPWLTAEEPTTSPEEADRA